MVIIKKISGKGLKEEAWVSEEFGSGLYQETPETRNKAVLRIKGGEGSGHHGHAGIPGHHGGSLPGKGGGDKFTINDKEVRVGDIVIAPWGIAYKVDEIIGGKLLLKSEEKGHDDIGRRFLYQDDASNWRFQGDDVDYSSMRSEPSKKPTKVAEDDPNFWIVETEWGETIDLNEGLETTWVDSYDDVKSSKDGKGYLISFEDRIADITGEFGGGTNDHPGFMAASADREKFGLTKREARDFMLGYLNGDPEPLLKGWNKVFKKGTIRVREFGDDIYIESLKVDRPTLRRLQKLYDDGKFGITIGKNVIWEDSLADTRVKFSYEDFLDASNVDTSREKLKESKNKAVLRIKGGEGSGHHGHVGRPGKRGGSLPGKGSGKEEYPKANPQGTDTFEQYQYPDGTWTKERQALHERIISHFFEGKTPVDNPQSYMMGGGPASGKTTLLESGLVDVPENSVLAAGDDIKGFLPEYENGKKAPFVHEESSYLAKVVMERASSQGYNVIFDGTGDGGIRSVISKVDKLSRAGQPVHGIYVTVDTDTAVSRAIARANRTGRYMPESILRANHAAVSNVFPEIATTAGMSSVKLFDTNGSAPLLIASSNGTKITVHNKELYERFLAKATQ